MPWSYLLSEDDEDDLLNDLKRAMKKTNDRLLSMGEDVPGMKGMAASLTLGFVVWPRLFLVHAGHSRAYLHRPPELRKITTDHTVAQKLQDRGVIEEEEDTAGNPWNKVLWNTLGGEYKDLHVEVRKVILYPGDGVLLCTDGLTNQVSEDRILRVLSDAESAEDVCRRLVDAANEAGGKDNATAVYARFNKVVS
jgi:protein phosphatase